MSDTMKKIEAKKKWLSDVLNPEKLDATHRRMRAYPRGTHDPVPMEHLEAMVAISKRMKPHEKKDPQG